MERLRIAGGRPLAGEVAVQGAKNAALPILAASLLSCRPTAIAHLPQVGDVASMLQILRQLGMTATPPETPSGIWKLTPPAHRDLANSAGEPPSTMYTAPARYVRAMRASFLVLAPLLVRYGRAIAPLPGGCRLGDRPVDLHLRGLKALGADIDFRQGRVVATARKLRGAEISLHGPHGPTVTGTAQLIMAASLAEGTTRLRGAAREPEINDLIAFLSGQGACIQRTVGGDVVIDGRQQLEPQAAPHRLIPDRVEAATLLAAGAITSGTVSVTGAVAEHLTTWLEVLALGGADIAVAGDHIRLAAPSAWRPGRRFRSQCLTARPFPGLPTDVQPLLLSLLCLGEGTSVLADAVFPDRFHVVERLQRLGARIRTLPGSWGAVAIGVPELRGARVRGSDLRATAALVLAALAARGVSYVGGLQHLDRGYERLERKLAALGADIRRQCRIAPAIAAPPSLAREPAAPAG